MKRAALVVALLALLAVPMGRASEAHPTLADLEGEIMCPVCSTTLDQSDSPIAQRMKADIRRRIAAGQSKQQIKDAMVAQFGPQILAAPPKKGFNLLAWRWSHAREPGPPAPQLSPALERRVDEELARYDEG